MRSVSIFRSIVSAVVNRPFHVRLRYAQGPIIERDITSGVHSSAIDHLGVLHYCGQWEMRPDLSYCNFQTVPYIRIQRRLLESSIFVKANGEKPVTIKQTCSELRGEKDGRLLVFTSYSRDQR